MRDPWGGGPVGRFAFSLLGVGVTFGERCLLGRCYFYTFNE